MFRFDESVMLKKLCDLRQSRRVMFALTCATRLMNFLKSASSIDKHALVSDADRLVQQLWIAIQQTPVYLPPNDLDAWYAAVLGMLPDESEGWTDDDVYIDHALSSLGYAIRCAQSGDPQEAAWAARRAYEAADQRAVLALDLVPGDDHFEEKALSHAAVQTELSRQMRDLELLRAELDLEVYEKAKSELSL